MVKRTASIEEVLAAIETARDKVMADEVKSLTKLGIPKAMAYQMIASRFHQKVGNQEEAEPDPFEGNSNSWEDTGEQQELELLQAVAQAVAQVRLGDRPSPPASATRPRPSPKTRATAAAPLVLIAAGGDDSDFFYATGFEVETGLYVRFAEGDELLSVSPLEIDQARDEGRIKRVLGYEEVGYQELGKWVSWPRVAARLLASKG